MTHLMVRGDPPGRRGPRRDAPASGKGRNAHGGSPRTTAGRFPLAARGVAARLWCEAPRRKPRLTSSQGKPVKWVIISEHWYRSVTTPIAMGIAEKIGGLPPLTAVLVILTGMTGAMLTTYTLNFLGIKDWRARGLAIGVASHGIGTARAILVHPLAGAFAGLAMGLNGVATALLLPMLAAWFGG